MLIECSTIFGPAPPCSLSVQAPHIDAPQSDLFDDAPAKPQARFVPSPPDDTAAHEWTEEELVFLHWRLLHELRRLCDPEHPLAEKIDTLNWVFTDPDKDAGPFSFANCLKVVGCSPLSPSPYVGRVDAEQIRDWIRANLSRWMRASLERYPQWMRALIRAQPEFVVRKLQTNPQWINEQIRQRGELFA